jgi:hypothetical protein
MTDVLVAKKKKGREKMKFKVVPQMKKGWAPSKYEKVIPNKDFNLLAYLFFDLDKMGYNIEKAYKKFKELLDEPDLFFLK